MIPRVLRAVRALFGHVPSATIPGMSAQPANPPPVAKPRRRARRVVLLALLLVVLAGLAGLGYLAYSRFFRSDPLAERPVVPDTGDALPAQPEFDRLAAEDPVEMLRWCLIRYQREVSNGARCTLEKQERVQGKPAPSADPPVELIELCVRGDTKPGATEVRMKWRSGARPGPFGLTLKGSLYSDQPEPLVRAWVSAAEPIKLKPNTAAAKEQSRYCIRDAGLYGAMLRSHTAWSRVKNANELRVQYLGKQKVDRAGGRECHVIRRYCPRPEVDSFEINGERPTDPKTVAAEGFTEVTLYIDAERWLQVGSVLERVEPDGTRVLIGAYFFREVELNPNFGADTFTPEGLTRQ
jgi:hypothetical protein